MSKPNFRSWRFAGQGILIDDDENEIVLGDVYSDDPIGWLIAAAPDLYQSVRVLLEAVSTGSANHLKLAVSAAFAALAKAEGR